MAFLNDLEQQMFGWETSLSVNGHEASIKHVKGNEVLSHLTFDAWQLDELIVALGKLRASMADEISDTLEINSRLEATVAPAWRIPDNLAQSGRTLALRHPGFGWLGFVIPLDQGEEMARWLSDHSLGDKKPPA